ncbi:hypothetical protein AB0Q95_32050 [Streptomyces sp. NPDC059900]|uniref:hypothetical protein n=1 Tax=Streptomyces sp. NPDC059900 TaxID=3155816 RepID=UPI00343D12C0
MSAAERDVKPRPHGLSGPVGSAGPAGISMRDLLASCAAASEVSTPPRDPAPAGNRPADRRPTERRRPSC